MSGRLAVIAFSEMPTDEDLRDLVRGYRPIDDLEHVIAWKEGPNLMTNVGRQQFTSRIINGNGTAMARFIGLTTENINAVAGTMMSTSTSLSNETVRKAAPAVASYPPPQGPVSTSLSGPFGIRFGTVWERGQLSTATYGGAGLFDSSSGGNLWAIASVAALGPLASTTVYFGYLWLWDFS